MGKLVRSSLPQEGNGLEDVFRRSRAETGQRRQAAIMGSSLELREGVYPQHVMNLTDLGYSKAGDFQHLDQARRYLFPQLLQHAGAAGVYQLGYNVERCGPDPFGRCQ